MSKRDEYIAFINEFKRVSPTITEEQRKGLLRRAMQEHGISIDEAVEIIDTSGLVIGKNENYFEVLGFSIDDFQNQSESSIASRVEAAHQKLYRESLNAGGRPRADGRTEEQWRTLLNQAKETLIDPLKRHEYVALLQQEEIETQFEDEEPPISEASDVNEKISQEISQQIGPSDIDMPDGMVFIPAGDFQMGSEDIDASDDEKPVHTVYVDAFYMDKYPVTHAQYKEFLEANPQWRDLGWYNYHLIFRKYRDSDYLKNWFKGKYPTGKGDHPVNWISWYAAMAYAKWMGKRLPTETEWEKAARGGGTGQKYLWGNAINIRNANFDKHVGETTPIGKYPPNGYGLYDIVGNVGEWCLDEWKSRFYTFSESRNPVSGGSIENIVNTYAKSKTFRVIRGGSWHSSEHEVRVSNRDKLRPWKTNSLIGFRCVKSIEP